MGTKLTRIAHKIFGSTASAGEIGQVGSLAAGSPVTTTDPTLIQSLANFTRGWFGIVMGGNSPAIEDLNGVNHIASRQIGYLYQDGIPDWDASTEYFEGSRAWKNDILYISKTDNNINNSTIDTDFWYPHYDPFVDEQKSTSSGTGSFTGSSVVDVTNVTKEILYLGFDTGRAVQIDFIPDKSGSASKISSPSFSSFWFIQRVGDDGTIIIGEVELQGIMPASVLNLKDYPPANGFYTYSLRLNPNGGTVLFYRTIMSIVTL